ncbi:MAG: hypothetical protein II453_12290 [Alphaproteobacteria bacterium]|nr:hypothetical protein [Alphaproteobacteria bacterium]
MSISAIEDVQALENAEADNVRSAKVIIDGKVYTTVEIRHIRYKDKR